MLSVSIDVSETQITIMYSHILGKLPKYSPLKLVRTHHFLQCVCSLNKSQFLTFFWLGISEKEKCFMSTVVLFFSNLQTFSR